VKSQIRERDIEMRRANRKDGWNRRETRAGWSGQTRFHTAAVIRDFTAAARAAGSETSYVCAGTNFLA